MKVQDIFGAAPKTVLNKPYMHVREEQASGTHGGSTVIGYNDRTLNTVVINEIAGASLNNNEVTLPAGSYRIKATFPVNIGAGQAKGFVRDSADNILAQSGQDSYSTSALSCGGAGALDQKLTFSVPTTIKITVRTEEAKASTGLGAAMAQGLTEVYSQLWIEQLDNTIETPVVSDPTMVLARPLFHAQDQKGSGVDGGTNITGINDRDLNTVLTNEISGALLASDEITLPAGTYFIKATATAYKAGRHQLFLYDSGNNLLLRGISCISGPSDSTSTISTVDGLVTLTEQTTVKLAHYTSAVLATYGLGLSNYNGINTYADIKIWQQDAVKQVPVLVNDKLYPLPGDTMVTGNMHGLGYEYTSANTITFQPGICMDSTNGIAQATPLELATAQVVTIGSVINTVYNLFLCDDGVVRTDTDVDGSTLAATNDALRWIGFVLTDASGDIIKFLMSMDRYDFAVDVSLGATSANTNTSFSITPFCPVSRVKDVRVIGNGSSGQTLTIYSDSTYSTTSARGHDESNVSVFVIPDNNQVHVRSTTTSGFRLRGINLKR